MVIVPGKKKNLAKRYYANFFDYVILATLLGLCLYLFGEANDSGGYTLRGVKAFIVPLIWFIYFPVCESAIGFTIGKKAFNLFVVDFSGETPSIIQTFLRRMLDPLEIIFLGLPSLLMINFSEKSQRIGDMIAGTHVVSTNAICRFCGTELELIPKEVLKDVFMCPNCKSVN